MPFPAISAHTWSTQNRMFFLPSHIGAPSTALFISCALLLPMAAQQPVTTLTRLTPIITGNMEGDTFTTGVGFVLINTLAGSERAVSGGVDMSIATPDRGFMCSAGGCGGPISSTVRNNLAGYRALDFDIMPGTTGCRSGNGFVIPANIQFCSLSGLDRRADGNYEARVKLTLYPAVGVRSRELVIHFLFSASNDSVPNAPPSRTATDQRFVTASGPGIRTPCLKRSQGPIEIPIDITRAVGAVDETGKLVCPGCLTENDVIAFAGILKIASFGRRLQGTSSRLDKVFLNGAELKGITGLDGEWTSDFRDAVVIDNLRFPAHRAGELPTPRRNILRILIDAADPAGPENWCTSIGWADITISALAPVVFVHGNGQGDDEKGGDFWEGGVLNVKEEPRLQMGFGFLEPFKTGNIPYDATISMFTAPTAAHGDLLAKMIPRKAAEWGAKHVHIVTHSKGALDSRDFLARTIPSNFGVYSIHTVAGPHHGSSGPDYQLEAQKASFLYAADTIRYAIGDLAPPNDGTLSLRVSEAERFNRENVPYLPDEQRVDGETHKVQYRSISADMNTNDSANIVTGNPTIEYVETFGLPGQGGKFDWLWTAVLQSCYRITGYVVNTYTEKVMIPNIGAADPLNDEKIQVTFLKENLASKFQLNDIAVTHDSSMVGPFQEIAHVKGNHSTIASPDNARIVLQSIKKIQPVSTPQ
jgi:hypothetical protein